MLKQRGQKTPEGYWSCEAADRNKDAILAVLTSRLHSGHRVTEIASGTGQHIVHFATARPDVFWQPTEPDADFVASIEARRRDSELLNIAPAIQLDVTDQSWPILPSDVIFNANMIHVSPPQATVALFQGAAAHLLKSGYLLTYGPYMHSGEFNSEGNRRFHDTLRQTNPEWGLRDIDWVSEMAQSAGLRLKEKISMPANNHCLIFQF